MSEEGLNATFFEFLIALSSAFFGSPSSQR